MCDLGQTVQDEMRGLQNVSYRKALHKFLVVWNSLNAYLYALETM